LASSILLGNGAPARRQRPCAALLSVSLCIVLSACALGPDYTSPALSAPPAWQAKSPHQGEQAEGNDWWSGFDDANLGLLVASAQKDSPALAQAWAAIRQARTTLTTDRAAGLPSVGAGASVGRGVVHGREFAQRRYRAIMGHRRVRQDPPKYDRRARAHR
jgi:outer membrane protein TolC